MKAAPTERRQLLQRLNVLLPPSPSETVDALGSIKVMNLFYGVNINQGRKKCKKINVYSVSFLFIDRGVDLMYFIMLTIKSFTDDLSY